MQVEGEAQKKRLRTSKAIQSSCFVRRPCPVCFRSSCCSFRFHAPPVKAEPVPL